MKSNEKMTKSMEIEFLATSHYVWGIELCSYMHPIVSVLSYPEASVNKDICTHPSGMLGLCTKCRGKWNNQSGVRHEYIQKDVWVSEDEAARIRERDLKNMLRHKKLYLVLDLDHTLLNSTHFIDATQEEGYLMNPSDPMQGGCAVGCEATIIRYKGFQTWTCPGMFYLIFIVFTVAVAFCHFNSMKIQRTSNRSKQYSSARNMEFLAEEIDLQDSATSVANPIFEFSSTAKWSTQWE